MAFARSMFAALMIVTTAASPKRQSFVSKVANAKQSLRNTSDEAFVKLWQQQLAKGDEHPSATEVRQFTNWYIPSFTLGMCQDHENSGPLAEWYSKLDSIYMNENEDINWTRDSAMRQGKQQYEAGAQGSSEASASFCKVELEAIGQFLQEF